MRRRFVGFDGDDTHYKWLKPNPRYLRWAPETEERDRIIRGLLGVNRVRSDEAVSVRNSEAAQKQTKLRRFGPDALGQFRTHAPQQKRISFRLFDRVLMHINLHSPDGSAILSASKAVVV
jgi:hypothetical protein